VSASWPRTAPTEAYSRAITAGIGGLRNGARRSHCRAAIFSTLFVQAAWVVLVKIKPTRWEGHGLKRWIEAAKKRLHHNVLAIALANKLARIAWSVLARDRAFAASKLQAA
jgi:hypothetical protein